MPQALTIHPIYAALIASGVKTLELRSRRLLRPGQRVVICAGSPVSATYCEVECVAVHNVADLPLRDVLIRACVRSLEPNYKIALELKVIRQLPPKRVRGNVGLWELRKSRHSRDAGYVGGYLSNYAQPSDNTRPNSSQNTKHDCILPVEASYTE